MEIKFQQSGSKGSFYIEANNTRQAEMTFSKAGDKLIIIDHTEVSDALRGKGAGKQLVEAAVKYARSHSIKILPLCPFAKSVFDSTPEFRDVLDV
jgi:predicted GNAT family acetyltransferase